MCISVTSTQTKTDVPVFRGVSVNWTDVLSIVKPEAQPSIPAYRVMNREGQIIKQSENPQVIIYIYTVILFCVLCS